MNKSTIDVQALIASITAEVTPLVVTSVTSKVLAALDLTTETPATPAQPAKPVTGKVYRSATAKAKARTASDKVWADAKAKAGVKRVKDLSAEAQAQCREDVKAIWAKAPKTRTTPAA